MPEDFYDLLEVPTDASTDEIKQAFREKARDHHPDVSEDDRATTQFQVLQKAYEVLSDPAKRDTYDALGHRTYVATELGGLPGLEGAGRVRGVIEANGGRATGEGGMYPGPATGITDDAPWWQQVPGTSATDGVGGTGSQRRRYYRTVPDHGPTPGIATLAVLAGSILCYAVGVLQFFDANQQGLSAFEAAVSSAGTEELLTVLSSAGYGIGRPLDFAMTGLADQSLAALFPIGASLFAGAAVVAAWEFERAEAVPVAIAGVGPISVLLLEYIGTTGIIDVPRVMLAAAGSILLFLLVMPACALVGMAALFYAARR